MFLRSFAYIKRNSAYLYLVIFICAGSLYSQNQPPIANNDTYNAVTNNPIIIVNPGIVQNDIDPEATVLRVNPNPVLQPSNGTVVLNTNGGFTYSPNLNFIGSDVFEYEICDSGIDDLISQFDFDTNSLATATVGPNASSINPNAVQAGCGIRIPSGATGGSAGLDVVVPNTSGIFNFRSFRVFFRYRDNESTADIVSGGNFRIYHITGNQIGVSVTVINSTTGIPTLYTVNLGNFGSDYNTYTVEYDEVTGDIIYQRNSNISRFEIAPNNSPLDTSIASNIIIGQFMDNAGNSNPSLCEIGIVDTSKLCDTANVTINVLKASLITNRRITYRVKVNN